MEKTVLISLPLEDLQTVIIDCVNSCLRNSKITASTATSDSIWLNVAELCQYHPDKPSRATIYGYVHAGTIPVHKTGKKLRFLRSEIDAWLLTGKKRTMDELKDEAAASFTKRGKG